MPTRNRWMWLLALPLAALTGCGSSKINALAEQEVQVTRQLTKIFSEVHNDKTMDYAVAAMEQPCVTLAHLRKQREDLLITNPSEMKSFEGSDEEKALNQATDKMYTAFFDARKRIPNRSGELDVVWEKAGLGRVGGR